MSILTQAMAVVIMLDLAYLPPLASMGAGYAGGRSFPCVLQDWQGWGEHSNEGDRHWTHDSPGVPAAPGRPMGPGRADRLPPAEEVSGKLHAPAAEEVCCPLRIHLPRLSHAQSLQYADHCSEGYLTGMSLVLLAAHAPSAACMPTLIKSTGAAQSEALQEVSLYWKVEEQMP